MAQTITVKYTNPSTTPVATFSPITIHFTPNAVLPALSVTPSAVNITENSAVITWSTAELTNYSINFLNGTCPTTGCTISDGTYTSGPRQKLIANLTSGTTYTFTIKVSTNDGRTATANLTFATLPPVTTSATGGTTTVAPTPIDTTLPEILSDAVPTEWDTNANPLIAASFLLSANTDYLKFYFLNQPDTLPDGSKLVPVAAANTGAAGSKGAVVTLYDPVALGNYTLAVVPGNNIVGDGIVKYYQIKVDKNFVYATPDITLLDYPELIFEPDFKPFQYNIDIKLTSTNTEVIEMYVGAVTAGQQPALTLPAGSPTTNISFTALELYSLYPYAFQSTTLDGTTGKPAGNYFVINFSFVPTINGVSGKISGKLEPITIYVKRSDIQLTDNQVKDYLTKKFYDWLLNNSNELTFDDDRYLKYQLKYQNGTIDSYVIANIGKDDTTFSIPTGKTYDVQNAVETEYIVDTETGNTTRKYPAYESLVVKLLEPLPGEIEINTQLWISKQLTPSIVEDVVITDSDTVACIPLTPNFSVDVLDQTGYQYFNDIVGSSATSTDIINKYISQSAFNLTDLAIDYASGSDITSPSFLKFNNFVNFSSAETRINNFQYKLTAIKFWENKISSSLFVGGTLSTHPSASATNQSYQNNIWAIKNGFDGFERKMYTNYSVTSSNSTFFTYQSEFGAEYDKSNKNYLVNHLPLFLTQEAQEGENEEFILFMEMIGQHFDVLWAYINGLHRAKIIRNSAEEGIPDKLVHALLENLGWDAQQPFGGNQLWKEAFGLNANGTQFTNTNILGNSITPAYSPEEARKQVWRRILNNLPYLLKHKGTKRAIHAIMACYGIPQSMLSVVEFSGAPANITSTTSNSTTLTSNYTYYTQTAQINLNGQSNISVPYYAASPPPTAVQLRFATDYQIPYLTSATGSQLIRMNQNGTDSYWQVNLVPSFAGSYGNVDFIISSGSSATQSLSITSSVLFDNAWKNVTVQKEQFESASITYDKFTLYLKEAAVDRLKMDLSASLIIPSSSLTNVFTSTGTLYFGSFGSTPGISGALDEARVWNTALSESVVNAHALNPDVIYGNDIYATTTNLLVRLDFEYPKDRNADPYIKNVSPKVNFSGSTSIGGYTGYATASMNDTQTTYPYHYTVYNRLATSTISTLGFSQNDKIREYTPSVIGSLSNRQRATKRITQTSQLDSNRLGVFFSPVKDLNLDIMHSLGVVNIGNYIGSWEDEYGVDTYKDLKTLKSYYFKRTNLNFEEYIKLVKSVDSSFFKMLNQIAGERVRTISGLLIEPSILDRSKIKITKPTGEEIYNSASISVEENFGIDSEYKSYDIVFSETDFSKNLGYEINNYQSDINTDKIFTVKSENQTIFTTSSISNATKFTANSIYSKNSNGASIEIFVDSKFDDASILKEYDLELSYENIGTDIDSPFLKGFGVIGNNGAVDISYRKSDGFLILTERKNAYLLTIKYTRKVPISDIDGNTTFQSVSKFKKKLLFVTQSDSYAGNAFRSPSEHSFYTNITGSLGSYPFDKGVITNIQLFDGYTTGHYRYTSDKTKGLENLYFNGSKQTKKTTLDKSDPVQVFATNPNTLKVSATGRGSGQPILEVT